MSERIAKAYVDVVLAAKGMGDVLLGEGVITEDQVRFTIEARKQRAKELSDKGLSTRQIAEVTGGSQTQVRRDLSQKGSESEPERLTSPDPPSNGSLSPTRQLLAQSDQNDWRTPRKFLDAARAVLGEIDLDPASGAEANETVKAAKFYTEADNGLKQPWKGRVWLNPPYGGDARLFVERLIKEYQVGNVTAACLLINSHPTETKWFQELFAYPICFVRSRIDFGGPSREVSSTSTHGSAIAYLGDNETKFAKTFSEFGAVVKRIAK